MTVLIPGVYRKGEPGFIEPGSDLHNEVLSPSKIAAIMGVSRFESAYRLWNRMKGITPQEPDRDDFRVGHAFEPALAYLWRLDNPGWRLSPGEVQFAGDASRFGFPFLCTVDRLSTRGRWQRPVEFKTCRGWEEWGDDGSDECPWDYLVQVTAQMLLSGLTDRVAHLMVLNKIGCTHHTYPVEFDPDLAAAIIDECRQFWASLQSDVPPPLDDSAASYECVREQHPEIDKGAEVEVPAELAAEYHQALSAEDEARTRARFAKTRLLDVMKRANYARCGEQRIARRQPAARGAVALYPIKSTNQTPQPQETAES